jgi:hypothetical protein
MPIVNPQLDVLAAAATLTLANIKRTAYLLPDADNDSYSAVTVISLRGFGDTAVNTGTTTAQVPTATDPAACRFATAASISSAAGAVGADNYRVGRNHKLQARVKISATANMRVFIGFTTNTLVNMVNTDTPTGNFAGFRYSTTAGDSEWKVITRDGATAISPSSTGVAISSANGFNFEIQEDVANAKWLFRINDVLVATVSSNLPSANTNMHWCVGVLTTENVAKNAEVGWIMIRGDM